MHLNFYVMFFFNSQLFDCVKPDAFHSFAPFSLDILAQSDDGVHLALGIQTGNCSKIAKIYNRLPLSHRNIVGFKWMDTACARMYQFIREVASPTNTHIIYNVSLPLDFGYIVHTFHQWHSHQSIAGI